MAEKVLTLEDRVHRFGLALESTRGDALDQSYRQGEQEALEWVLSVIDMGYTLRQLTTEMENFLSTRVEAPSLPTEKPDEPENEEDDDDDD